MFCSKCGNPLPDDAKFCSVCGAPVKISQEASPVPQQPAGISDETENIQTPKPEPLMQEPNFNGQMGYGATASVQKKSKKGLIIGLSLGGVLLAVILAVTLIFVFGLSDGSFERLKGPDPDAAADASTDNPEMMIDREHASVPVHAYGTYDAEYTYYILEGSVGGKTQLMRLGNGADAEPEVLFESELIMGYPFLWDEKICFINCDSSTMEFSLRWVSRDGGETGTIAELSQLNQWLMGGADVSVYCYEDSVLFSAWGYFLQIDLNTGEFRGAEDILGVNDALYFLAYQDGSYYYFIPDTPADEPGGVSSGGTLYRKAEGEEAKALGTLSYPVSGINAAAYVPKENAFYFSDYSSIYRASGEGGDIDCLYSADYMQFNRLAFGDRGYYQFKRLDSEGEKLAYFDLETGEETLFDLPEEYDSENTYYIKVFPGSGDSGWVARQIGDTLDYYRFLPDDSCTHLGSTTQLYAEVVRQAIAAYGSIGFHYNSNEYTATGVFKVDLVDFNGDGTEEMLMLYNDRSNGFDGIFPTVEVWTVKGGKAVQLFSEKTREEFHEDAALFSLYQNDGKLYVPVYDSLDHDPVYVHLYGFDGSGEFTELYQYENNAFYMNQLPDGMEFTKYDETRFYTNTQLAYDEGFENAVKSMEETLRADMANILEQLGIATTEIPSTQTSQSGFDTTSMLGEWTLEIAQPNTENVSRHLIRLNADGTMTLRAEDGSWIDYTYTMDETHFYYTYSATGITGGGTYAISGDKIILSKES